VAAAPRALTDALAASVPSSRRAAASRTHAAGGSIGGVVPLPVNGAGNDVALAAAGAASAVAAGAGTAATGGGVGSTGLDVVRVVGAATSFWVLVGRGVSDSAPASASAVSAAGRVAILGARLTVV
jgi:hypothetical protein